MASSEWIEKGRLLGLAALLLACRALSPAAVLEVPEEHASIQAAIQAAAPGDEVLVGPGSYSEAVMLQGKPIHLRSREGSGKTFLEPPGNEAALTLDDAGGTAVEGFTFTGKSSVLVLRGIGSVLTLRDCVISGFYGILAHEGVRLEVERCVFEVEGEGARLSLEVEGSFRDCRFRPRPGASGTTAIAAHGGAVRAVQCLFEDLELGISGGPSPLEVEGCLFFDCVTGVSGWGAGQRVAVRNSLFVLNGADFELPGGGLDLEAARNLSYGRPPRGSGSHIPQDPASDPLLIDARGGDYRPGIGSPAIDAGEPGPATADLDYSGSPRLQGLGLDIGPFEGAAGAGERLLPVRIHVPSAVTDLEDAVRRAVSGDTVVVSPGTYRVNLVLAGKEMTLTAAGGADEPVLQPARPDLPVVSISGASGLSGFRILGDGEAETGIAGSGAVTLSGVEVRGFRWGIISSGRIEGCLVAGNGVGIQTSRGPPTEVTGSTVEENGNGIFIGGADAIRGNVIRRNRGFAIHGHDTSLGFIEDNVIEENAAGVYLEEVTSPSPVVRWNRFLRNRGQTGGALQIEGYEVEVTGNVFLGNDASQWGGAVSIRGGSVRLFGNLFARNRAPFGGALSLHEPGQVQIVGNTFADNEGWRAGGGILATGVADGYIPLLVNNVFWGNRSTDGAVSDLEGVAPENVRSSLLEQAGFAGARGNISEDPLFADPLRDDYHLRPESPCIDRGESQESAVPPNSDLVELAGQLDFDRDDRLLDGDADGLPEPDMGADEFSPGPAVRLGDCDWSGALDVTDAIRLARFLFLGDVAPPCLSACDGSRDGRLDLSDAILVLERLFWPRAWSDLDFDLGRCRHIAPRDGEACSLSSCP